VKILDNFYFPCENPMYRKNPMPMPGPMPMNENLQMHEPMNHQCMMKHKLARAYIPDQPYTGLFPLSEALRKGTIFPNLYIPFPIKSKE
jgi:hypothetical protein